MSRSGLCFSESIQEGEPLKLFTVAVKELFMDKNKI